MSDFYSYQDYLKRFNELCSYNRTKGVVKENRNQLDMVKSVVQFLNDHYEPGETTNIGVDGRITQKKVIGVKGKDGIKNIIATQISPLDVFYRIEEEFKNDIEKSEKRDFFLKSVIIDWFNGYEGLKNGILSKNISY